MQEGTLEQPMHQHAGEDPSGPGASLAERLGEFGLVTRGGFVQRASDAVPDAAPGVSTRYVVLVGNAGPAMWEVFAPHAGEGNHPLDRWTRSVIEPVAARFGARAVFPFEAPPLPFQRWARRAEGLSASPLGLLIHPVYGLWHAYRAALLFPETLEGLPSSPAQPSPCETCDGKPCLSACPVGAFTGEGYDVPACATHLASAAGGACREGGCRARDACPVGRVHRYPDAQIRFHMRAFARSVCG